MESLEIELLDHLTVCINKMFTNHIFNAYIKIGFGIKKPTMVDIHKIKPNQIIIVNAVD